MLGSITADAVTGALPVLFSLSYVSQRGYSDPITCGNGCLHLPGCRFYRQDPNDRRRFASSVESEPESGKNATNTIKGFFWVFGTVAAVATIVPAVFWTAYQLRQIRFGWMECRCNHAPTCDLGRSQYIPPPGCENWSYRAGGYDAPDGKTWVKGIKTRASSARVSAGYHASFTHKRADE